MLFDEMMKVESYSLNCDHCLIGHGKLVARSKGALRRLYESHLHAEHHTEWEYLASRALRGEL